MGEQVEGGGGQAGRWLGSVLKAIASRGTMSFNVQTRTLKSERGCVINCI